MAILVFIFGRMKNNSHTSHFDDDDGNNVDDDDADDDYNGYNKQERDCIRFLI